MSWFSVIPMAALCMALLFLPGTLIVLALGLRNPAFVAVAPLLTVSIVAVSAMLAPYAGVSWSLLPVLVASLSIAAVLFAARKILKLRQPRLPWRMVAGTSRQMPILAAAGFVIGAASIALQLRAAFGRPENISQTFDNVFHLNAIRYVLETGNASSMTITGMTNGDNPPYFYPAAWHGLA